jgi:hypothetical protein
VPKSDSSFVGQTSLLKSVIPHSVNGYRPYRAALLYIELLRIAGIAEPILVALSECHARYFGLVVCPDGNYHYEKARIFKARGCRLGLCPICTHSRITREVEYAIVKVKSWYKAFGGSLRYAIVDATLPGDLQKLVTIDNRSKIELALYAAYAEIRGGLSPNASLGHIFRDSEFELAGWVNEQDWSSENPLMGGFYPHVHSTWLNIRFSKGGIPERFPIFLTPLELEALKRAWTRRAQDILGQSSYHDTFDLYVHYGSEYRSLKHRLSYQMRYASKDVNRVCKDGIYWKHVSSKQAQEAKVSGLVVAEKKGRYWLRCDLDISKVETSEVLRLCERPKRKNVNGRGWISPHVLKKHEALLGVPQIKRSVLMRQLSQLYCGAHVNRNGKIVVCGCILEVVEILVSEHISVSPDR